MGPGRLEMCKYIVSVQILILHETLFHVALEALGVYYFNFNLFGKKKVYNLKQKKCSLQLINPCHAIYYTQTL